MYVQYVASNAKGVVSCRLGQKTLLLGSNGTGKTGVINSLELALGGFASDVAGRESMAKDNELIAALTPERKGELFARAVLDNGASIVWKAGGSDSKKAVHLFDPAVLDPKKVFALQDIRDAVRGNAQTARKFFLAFATPNVTKDDVLREITPRLHPFFNEAILNTDVADPPVDKLVHALEVATKRARGTKTMAKGQQEIAGAIAPAAPMPTDETFKAAATAKAAAKFALEKLDQQRGAYAERQRMRESAEPLKHEITQAEDNIRRFDELLVQADARAAALPQPVALDAFNLKVIEIVREMAAREQNGVSGCPCCRSPVALGTFTTLAQRADAHIAAQAALIEPHNVARRERDELLSRKASWVEHLKAKQIELGVYQEKLASSDVPVVDQTVYDAAKAALAECDANLTSLETAKAQWAQSRKAEDVAKDTNESSLAWASLRDEAQAAVGKLLDTGVRSFVASVQQFLPPTDKFGLMLREGQKPVFRYGLEQNGILRTALCGGEEARVLAAMAAVCTPKDNKISVISLPDRALHPDTLEAVMQAFLRMPQQVILASPVPPRQMVAGWTVVNTGAGEHRTATFP
jgi:hypothetical protein